MNARDCCSLWPEFSERLAAVQAMGTAQFARWRQERLTNVVSFARAHSPFFRKLYRNVRTEALELECLPVINKETVKSNFDRYFTVPGITTALLERYFQGPFDFDRRFLGQYHAFHTSGSTGNPSYVVWGPEEFEISCCLLRSANRFLDGSGKRKRFAYIGILDDFVGGNSWVHGLRAHADIRMFNIFDDEEKIAEQILQFRPHAIASKPHWVAGLARRFLADEVRLTDLEDIVVAGENMTAPDADAIAAAFHVVPRNSYSTCETGPIAVQVGKEKKLTVFASELIVEILDDSDNPAAGPGIEGRVVVTSLYNRVMPVIRYDVGDVAAYLMNSGARQELTYPKGRATTKIKFVVDNRRYEVSEYPLWSLQVPGLARYQIVQDGPAALRIRLQWDRSFQAAERAAGFDQVVSKLRRLLGSDDLFDRLRIVREDVESIETNRAGKLKLVVPWAAGRTATTPDKLV